MIRKNVGILALVMGFGLFFSCLFTGNVFGKESSVEERIKSLEQSIKKLEEANKALELKAQRAQDVIEIQNLQARYCAVHNTQEHLSWMLFADRPDTSKEITMEKIIGFDNIKASYFRMAEMAEGGGPSGSPQSGAAPAAMEGGGGFLMGMMGMGGSTPRYGVAHIHPIGTPCIVVADDGKTAKATFTSLGFEDGWCYGMYANSYIKIDGEWKIWHMKWLRCFKTPFDTYWNDQTIEEIYEFTQGQTDEWGFPLVNTEIDYSYLNAPGKVVETITAPKPYATWTEEDEDGGWWKRETIIP